MNEKFSKEIEKLKKNELEILEIKGPINQIKSNQKQKVSTNKMTQESNFGDERLG